MRDLVVIGAGGHGREVADVVAEINLIEPTWRMLGYYDDEPGGLATVERRGESILGTVSTFASGPPAAEWIIAIGNSAVRAEIDRRLRALGAPAATVVHPRAEVGRLNSIADGVFIASGCHVTTEVMIGRHTHLNIGTVIQHDSTVGEYVTFSPGVFVNGDVRIGDGVFFGTAAVVTRGVSIGDGATVGAGAVVLDDVEPGGRVFGIPAAERPGR